MTSGSQIRKPSVAGQFYSSSPSGLSREVEKYVLQGISIRPAIGMVSPHAGLMYSGSVAGALYSRIEFPGTFIVIGPNHTGMGKPVSIMRAGEWEIPTGSVKVDSFAADRIMGSSSFIEEDISAHAMEHSLEVQIPFILHFSTEARIVPITMMTVSQDVCRNIGEAIAGAVENSDYPVTIIASSDMSHFESDTRTREKDKRAIDRILDLDPEGLYRTVTHEGISMCGFIPATTMLFAAQRLGAEKAVLVKYMTSGEINGDFDRVVGYAGILVF